MLVDRWMRAGEMCKVCEMTCGDLNQQEVSRSASRQDPAESKKTSLVHFNPLPQMEGEHPLAAESAPERLRNFESTKRGRIVNRGDSVRREKVRPCLRRQGRVYRDCGSEETSLLLRSMTLPDMPDPLREVSSETRRVLLLGTSGVGKKALCRQFQTSEYTNDFESDIDSESTTQRVNVCLNGTEMTLIIDKLTCTPLLMPDETTVCSPDALIVVYSVVDPPSFCAARGLCHLISSMAVRRPVILVASKCDLVRLRKVTAKDGRALAVEFGFKYIETSVVINSNIDELLAGIVAQIRFYNQVEDPEAAEEASKATRRQQRKARRMKSRTLPSLIVKEILQKVIGQKESKSCDNLMTV